MLNASHTNLFTAGHVAIDYQRVVLDVGFRSLLLDKSPEARELQGRGIPSVLLKRVDG